MPLARASRRATGIARYRRQLERINREKVIVFIGEIFAVMRHHEFALLAGATVRGDPTRR